MTTTTIITTCKGRLAALARSLETWLRMSDARVIVVSDGCPDIEVHQESLELARVSVVHTTADIDACFSKPRALNYGAWIAHAGLGVNRRQEHLLFLDSDTLMTPAFWPWYVGRHEEDVMFIAEPSLERRDLTGVLGVTAHDFDAVAGADEGFVGWGSEDLDLRLRIYLKQKPRIVTIPAGHLEAIPHSDALRTRHYAEKNLMESQQGNLRRLTLNAERMTGQSIWALLEEDNVRLLLGRGFSKTEEGS